MPPTVRRAYVARSGRVLLWTAQERPRHWTAAPAVRADVRWLRRVSPTSLHPLTWN